jgi:hypothetical protein
MNKPNAFLRLCSWMDENIVEIQDLGSPGIHESKTGLLPSRVKAEGAQAFFEFRGSKESSRRFAVAINHAGVDCSGITGSKMKANKDESIRSSDGVFKDTKSIALLLGKK